MADELLGNQEKLGVRVYNVGLGDCIYVRVPDKKKPGPDKHVHILIDCGNKFGDMDVLQDKIKNLAANLPLDQESGKRVLDLLVVTHPHEDHHKGFEPSYFENIRIKNLWLSPAFCELDSEIPEKSKQKKGNNLSALQAVAQSGLTRLVSASPAGETKEYLEDLLQSLSKADALGVLNGRQKDGKALDVEERRYVSWDFSYETNTQKDLAAVNKESKNPAWKPFTKDDLKLFHDPKTRIKILGPRGNLDTYLGKPKPTTNLQGVDETQNVEVLTDGGGGSDNIQKRAVPAPRNISIQDFELLRAGIQSNVLAAAAELGHAVNNTSIVLLLEWKSYRLLFPGDAEWDGSNLELKDANNGSWNVMWQDDKDGELKKTIDFLKVGHHGSENATPWALAKDGKNHPIIVILDALLPEPKANKKPTALAVVSTHETARWPSIPDPRLLMAIGKRVSNVKVFKTDLQFENFEREKYNILIEKCLLPARTDQYDLKNPAGTEELTFPWIDVFFPS